jgi:oligosaccharide repeat unit polymerase
MFNKLINLKINKNTFIISFSLILMSCLVIVYLIILNKLTLSLILILFIILTLYFIFEKQFILFDPFTLFTLYYYTVVVSCWYLLETNFDNNIFIEAQSFTTNLNELLNITIIYLIFCYIFAYIGYKTFKKQFTPSIDINNDNISINIINILIPIFIVIAMGNFYFNILKFAGGNPFEYMTNVSIRHIEFGEIGGTTLGYNFGYFAGYFWLYRLFKTKSKITVLFILFVILTIFMKASTGRIFGTMAYGFSFVIIYYFMNYKIETRRHKKYFLGVFIVIIAGLLFYFFRITSSLSYNNMIETDFYTTVFSFVDMDMIAHLAVDKGNIPNVALLMKIIDSWGTDIQFLYGESLFTWLSGFIPSSFRLEGYQPSVIIKTTWYSHIRGGNLPPTGMGEMFINFWYFGAVFGMFIFGALNALIYNLLNKFNNYWYLLIYSNLVILFAMLYPKGEFDNIPIMTLLFILVVYMSLYMLSNFNNRKRE